MCALYSFPLRRIRRLPQLNSDKAWKKIFDGKLSEEVTIPDQYIEIIIQITIGYTNGTDVTLPEIYINDLATWWNKITSYRYNDAYNACILHFRFLYNNKKLILTHKFSTLLSKFCTQTTFFRFRWCNITKILDGCDINTTDNSFDLSLYRNVIEDCLITQ